LGPCKEFWPTSHRTNQWQHLANGPRAFNDLLIPIAEMSSKLSLISRTAEICPSDSDTLDLRCRRYSIFHFASKLDHSSTMVIAAWFNSAIYITNIEIIPPLHSRSQELYCLLASSLNHRSPKHPSLRYNLHVLAVHISYSLNLQLHHWMKSMIASQWCIIPYCHAQRDLEEHMCSNHVLHLFDRNLQIPHRHWT